MATIGKTCQEYWAEMYSLALDVMTNFGTNSRSRCEQARRYADRKTRELFGDSVLSRREDDGE